MEISHNKRPKSRRGAIMVLLVLMLPVILILAAFIVSLVHIELTSTELQAATDAATRAGGRVLIVSGSEGQARAAAKQFAEFNTVAGESLTLGDSDIVFGRSLRSTPNSRYSFSLGGRPNSIQITGRRTASSPDGPVQTLLSGFLANASVDVEKISTSTQVEIDIALCIDRSGSMAYAANERAVFPPKPASAPPGWNFCDEAPPASRWRDVVNAVRTFAGKLNNSPIDSRLAIVTYSDGARVDRGLSANIAAAPNSLDRYTRSFCSGQTNIGAGMQVAGSAIADSAPGSRRGAIRVIVVLTDGIRTAGPNPESVASTLANDGALIFSITFSNEADRSLMQRVAARGKGDSFHATDAASLDNAFTEIAKKLPTLITE